jgi:hypothetical protein
MDMSLSLPSLSLPSASAFLSVFYAFTAYDLFAECILAYTRQVFVEYPEIGYSTKHKKHSKETFFRSASGILLVCTCYIYSLHLCNRVA